MSNGAGEPGDHQLTQSAITSANETACYHLGRGAKREGGDLIHQSLTTPGTVLQALIDAAGPDTVEYRAAVAYVTGDGARRLAEGLAEKLGPAWTGMPKVIVTCFDFGSTDLAALDLLRDEHNFEVRIANLQPGAAVALVGQSSFHPKVYLAYGSGDHVTAVIGSANLGRRALTVNTEVVTTTTVSRSEADAMWSELQDSSVVLTEELAAYIAARPLRLKAPRQVEPPVPTPVAPITLPVFREVVESGSVVPANYEAFWVEIGGPSGGSGNQLELPRRAQRFFGYTFDDYDDQHHVIGEPVLRRPPDASWSRPLTWHGNNRMERINLPTLAQGGVEYSHRVVLFRRLADGSFELAVATLDSSSATAWRNESSALGTIYRFGPNSPRRCGLF